MAPGRALLCCAGAVMLRGSLRGRRGRQVWGPDRLTYLSHRSTLASPSGTPPGSATKNGSARRKHGEAAQPGAPGDARGPGVAGADLCARDPPDGVRLEAKQTAFGSAGERARKGANWARISRLAGRVAPGTWRRRSARRSRSCRCRPRRRGRWRARRRWT